MEISHIRNFSIIAHIDHGKSTLSDRMLEATQTVEQRKMREQMLDTMELERERGITIKMQPVRMEYQHEGMDYVLNLIDTPGHIDFSYEVSRSLKAVEGALLLVDSTQGVQAQTMTTLAMARDLGLVIIPVITKIDSPLSRPDEIKEEIVDLLGCGLDDILAVSGKTGEGVAALLQKIVEVIPPPIYDDVEKGASKSLVFDFEYSSHRGIIVYTRLFAGQVKKGDELTFAVTGEKFTALEVGVLRPQQQPKERLETGEIGYVVTGMKDAASAFVGDTLVATKKPLEPLPGYQEPQPVVWASLYPESQDDFLNLKQALFRLKLSDSSLSFEEESSPTLGRGFRCGFLGMLHLEIVVERLRRESDMALIVTAPSIIYEIIKTNGDVEIIYSPANFPDKGTYQTAYEPWVEMTIITPNDRIGEVMQVLYSHEAEVGESQSFSDTRLRIIARLPLRELMRGFFDELKSASSGYASLSYEIVDSREAHVARLDILVAEEVVAAFSQVIAEHRVREEAKAMVERLYTVLPRQLFVVKIQGKALGQIIASKTLSALRKDVTAKLYGGDITRKMKLREKQKKGKKKMRERGKVNIPHDVFLKMVKGDSK